MNKRELSQVVLYPERGKATFKLSNLNITFPPEEVEKFLSEQPREAPDSNFFGLVIHHTNESAKLELFSPGVRPADKSTRLGKVSFTLKQERENLVADQVRAFCGSPAYLLLLLAESTRIRLVPIQKIPKATIEREFRC